VYNVRINVASLSDRSIGARLLEESRALLESARASADAATSVVESAIGA
jgi:formiminotetrahydrofolate cyclodeaminase